MSAPRSDKDHSMINVELPRRAMQLAADKLPPGAVVLLVAAEDLAPEFIRLPDGKKRCPVTGMSRTWVVDRIKESQLTEHKVRAHHIREKGSTRGTVLIGRQSWVEFIESHPPPDWAQPPAEEVSSSRSQVSGSDDAHPLPQ